MCFLAATKGRSLDDKGDVGNRREHDDAAEHGERLQPHELVTTDDSEVERAHE